MPDVVVESFPLSNSLCIIGEFAATHVERVTFSNVGFPLAVLMTIFAPPMLIISCSSSLLS